MATRVRVARYLAEQLAAGKDRRATIRTAAAWLVSRGRTRDAGYLARDTATALAEDHGYLLVRMTTARPLPAKGRRSIEVFLKERTGAQHLELVESVDPSLIGGVRLDLPQARLDATIRRELTALIEGAVR